MIGLRRCGIHLYVYVWAQSLSCVLHFVTLWTVDCQALLSMKFFRQEYWSGLPFPTPVDLPNSRIKPASLTSPALAFTTSTSWEALKVLLPPCKEGGHVVVRMHTWFKG